MAEFPEGKAGDHKQSGPSPGRPGQIGQEGQAVMRSPPWVSTCICQYPAHLILSVKLGFSADFIILHIP